jgi:hypothetical protein
VTTFVTLTEVNEHEGETCRFYIPLEGNNEALGELFEAICGLDKGEDEQYALDLTPVPESEVDILIKHSDSGYMPYYNKLVGVLTLPEDFAEGMADPEEDPLYKGEIKQYMKVPEPA